MVFSLTAVLLLHRVIPNRRLSIGVLCVTCLVLSFFTYSRNAVWKNEISLYRDCLLKSPNKSRPNAGLGAALLRQGELDEAIFYLKKAVQMDPDNATAHNNLGVAYYYKDNAAKAIFHYTETLKRIPIHAEAQGNLELAKRLRDINISISEKTVLLSKTPGSHGLLTDLGNLYMQKGKLDEAERYFDRAIKINPEYAESWNGKGMVMVKKGKIDQATVMFSRAVQIDPEYLDARNNLYKTTAIRRKIDKRTENSKVFSESHN